MKERLYKELIEIDRINKVYNYPFTKNKDDVNVFTEKNLRNAIINPILDCLGWDYCKYDDQWIYVYNGCHEEHELGKGIGRVDYALIHNGIPKVFIECKKGDLELEDIHKKQLKRYMEAVPVEFGVLTNGFEWRFYVLNKSDLKRFYTIRLEDPKKEIISTFIDLLSENNVRTSKSLEIVHNMNKKLNSSEVTPQKDNFKTVKLNKNKNINYISKTKSNDESKLVDYQKLWRKYKRYPSRLSEEEKEKLAEYINEYGYIN